jgi:hypothetical protein
MLLFQIELRTCLDTVQIKRVSAVLIGKVLLINLMMQCVLIQLFSSSLVCEL